MLIEVLTLSKLTYQSTH